MIKQADKDKAKLLGFDIDAIIAAHEAKEEAAINIPDGKIFTDAELETRDTQVKTAAKTEGKAEGEASARTALITEVKNRLSIDVTGERLGDIVKGISTELAKQTGDAKISQLTQQVQALQADKEGLTNQLNQATETAKKTVFEAQQYSLFPANKTPDMKDNERLTLMQLRGIEIKEDGVYRNGVVMVDDKTKSPLTHDKAYEQIFTEYKWVSTGAGAAAPAGGRGGSNNNSGANGKARSTSEALKMWKEQNPDGNEMSPEASDFIDAQAKGNPSFAYNE